MCGRYTATDPEAILRELESMGIEEIEFELSPRYNVAPSQVVPVVASDASRVLVGARWGLIPPWARSRAGEGPPKPLINARSETAAHKPSFRDGVKARRCLVFADGYYEWKRDGKRKTPHHFRARTGRPFSFAGVWAPGTDDDPIRTFAILTMAADAVAAPVHDRMPVILGPDAQARWLVPGPLEPAAAEAILYNADPPEMMAYAVKSAVGSPSVDDPSCVEPVEAEEPAPRQPSLFD